MELRLEDPTAEDRHRVAKIADRMAWDGLACVRNPRREHAHVCNDSDSASQLRARAVSGSGSTSPLRTARCLTQAP